MTEKSMFGEMFQRRFLSTLLCVAWNILYLLKIQIFTMHKTIFKYHFVFCRMHFLLIFFQS